MPSETGFDRYRPLVDDWDAFMRTAIKPLPTCIWTNTLRTDPASLSRRLHLEGVASHPLPWNAAAFRLDEGVNPGGTLSYLAGLYHVQEEVSLLPVFALAPCPGERVLDLCAAPGNKTVHAAVALENRGTVVANDRSGIRLNVLRTALYRLGIVNVSTTVGDATTFPGAEESFDCVIADVPCSCEGTSRKHPHVVRRSSRSQSEALAIKQRSILLRAASLCRPGGRIVYATCTYAPEENEMVLEAALRSNAALSVKPVAIPGFQHAPGVTAWGGHELRPELSGALRVWPHQNDSGGFFVAVLEKRL